MHFSCHCNYVTKLNISFPKEQFLYYRHLNKGMWLIYSPAEGIGLIHVWNVPSCSFTFASHSSVPNQMPLESFVKISISDVKNAAKNYFFVLLEFSSIFLLRFSSCKYTGFLYKLKLYETPHFY